MSSYICLANVLFNVATMACFAIIFALLISVTEEIKIRKRRKASKRSFEKGPRNNIEINFARTANRNTPVHIPTFFVVREMRRDAGK